MCGIVGYLDKHDRTDSPVGRTLLDMLQALSCRGPDSAGVALFGRPAALQLRLSLAPEIDPAFVTKILASEGVTVRRHYDNGVYDGEIHPEIDLERLQERIESRLPSSEVLCLGEHMDLFKQVGSPDQLEATYHISGMVGTHGIGHTRLSTESRVDLSHSQPFWAHGELDLATAHNGHITNYHKLRRQYEQHGYRFYTENDSEVIGVYLRDRLAAGLTLEDALRCSLDDFDGSFSYLAASGDRLAYVRDRFGFKPLVVAETEEFVAVATEEIAIRRALGEGFVAKEPAPGTMKVWQVPALQTLPAR